MHLKRIKLFGFKTFADRTEFDLNASLTAVVGPNGCGKSNLVDALLWALGEANARALRAGSAPEVIFSGSANRKPLNMAEVTLTFSNDDGTLPLPTAEVAVGRRIYRSGESEYLLNKQTCRLKDIVDLFAGTGLGRSGYSIVGQKEVDAVLSATPEERRVYLDEAAGIQKYRVRKVDALKRLATAAQHLQRVEDVVSELERERGPLEREAEKARRFKDVSERLSAIESGLLVIEFSNATSELELLNKLISEAQQNITRLDAQGQRSEQEISAVGERIAEIEQAMDALRMQQQGQLTALERAESRVALIEQRERSLNELEATLVLEAQSLEEQAATRAEAAQRWKAQLERYQTTDAPAEKLVKAKAEQQERELELREIEAKLRELAAKQLKWAQEQARTEEKRARIGTLREQLEAVRQAAAEAVARAQELAEARDTVKGRVETKAAELLALQGDAQEINAKLGDTQATERSLLSRIAQHEGRLGALKEAERTLEGYHAGARFVLSAARQGKLKGEFTSIADAISVPEEYRVAIETALGGSLQDIITEDSEQAREAVDLLKKNSAGRATFLPLDLMDPGGSGPAFAKLKGKAGVVGSGDELVTCEKRHRKAIQMLLGRTLVVEDIDGALRIARENRRDGWSRLVTLDGELISGSGAVSGGRMARPQEGLLKRRVEREKLETELAAMRNELEELERRRGEYQASLRDLQEARTSVGREQEALRGKLLEAERDLSQADQRRAAEERREQEINREMNALAAEEGAQGEPPDAKEQAALERQREEARAALDRALAETARADAERKEQQRRLQELQDRLRQEERLSEEARRGAAGKRERLEAIGEERKELRRDRFQAFSQREQAQDSQARCEAELGELREKRQELLEENFRLQEQAKERRNERTGIADSLHEMEVQQARLDVKRNSLTQRLVEEFGITPAEALNAADGIDLPEDAAQQVAKLRREARALGNVNLGAIEAFDRLNERYSELTTQREDLLEAKRQLENAVREIDRSTRDRFNETFDQAQEAFGRIFQRLFEGGEARMVLTDPENRLESGVDIEVQIPGKRKQRLELLSGGERSLTATAFLFALMEARPSPLCVLDEVDAALDGRNVERYVDLLKDYCRRSQFIVVTHNPITIEAAQVWYGVTMSEPGVSRIIPYKLAEAEAAVGG